MYKLQVPQTWIHLSIEYDFCVYTYLSHSSEIRV